MPPGEEMGFELIRQVQLRESRSQAPTKVPADFFEQLAVHIDRLKALAREEMARDPMSARATLVQNELRSTVQAARDIVMLRLRKLANRAVDALEGGKVDLHNLTPSERELYQQLASFVSRGRDVLLPSEGTAKGARATQPTAPDEGADGEGGPQSQPLKPAAVATGLETPTASSASAPAPAPAGAAPGDLVVHVLKDVPQFAGEGGSSYALRAGDVVNLPRRLAEVLVQRGVAEAVDVAHPGKA